MTREEWIIANCIRLADDHRSHCTKDCNISLMALQELIRVAGYELTTEQMQHFI